MRKLLTMLMLLQLMLPMAAQATNGKVKVKSMALTLPVPTAGMTMQEAQKLALTAATTSYGDLVAQGAVSVQSLTWDGEFDDSKPEYPKFKAGYTYAVTIVLELKTDGKYICNYAVRDGDECLDDQTFSATVNGKPADVQISAPYFPSMQAFVTVPGGNGKVLARASGSYQEEHHLLLGMRRTYTTQEADALWVGKQAMDVVILNDTNRPEDGHTSSELSQINAQKDTQRALFITKAIVDTKDIDEKRLAYTIKDVLSAPYNLRELWLSDKMDCAKFIRSLHQAMTNPLSPTWRSSWEKSQSYLTARGAVCIPASQLAAVKPILETDPTGPVYTLRVYSGDVYAAQKAGMGATRDWCTRHVYTKRIKSSDRLAHYPTCQIDQQFYYSCRYCGKCERNPKHTFSEPFSDKHTPVGKSTHGYWADLATDEAYVGVNAAGEHVYWRSCIWCHRSSVYHRNHISVEEWKSTGTDASYQLYTQQEKRQIKTDVQMALAATEPLPGMFTLPARTKAKVALADQDGVQRAVSDHLVADEQALGSDFTRPVSRVQMVGMAVRLAEEMTGRAVKTDAAKRYADTTDPYAAKAAAMGLTEGFATGNLSPAAAVSRQEMATILYRALRYIEKHSDYTYTDYTPNLGAYTDAAQVKDWAREAMGFMTTLELMVATAGKQLAPGQPVTIGQALSLTESCLYAHRIGWYQAIATGEKTEGGWDVFVNVIPGPDCFCTEPNEEFSVPTTLVNSDRIWVMPPMMSTTKWLVVRNPDTHQVQYLDAEWFRPVRWRSVYIDYEYPEGTKKAKAVAKVSSKVKKAGSEKAKKLLKKGLGGLGKLLK